MECKHLECKETSTSLGFCEFHLRGGIFATGETYEQYQIIERDFINFIRVIPLNEENNLKVYSPVLRDIIIRSCVQIELFFKEWAKFVHYLDTDNHIYDSYFKTDKNGEFQRTRHWYFKNYFFIKEKFLRQKPLHVRDLDIEINCFDDWQQKDDILNWWNAYNSIKHDGINKKSYVNLEIALMALGALFTLHCSNPHTRAYLQEFSQINIRKHINKVHLKNDIILTPIDTRKYLFKDIISSFGKWVDMTPIDNDKRKDFNDLVSFKNKKRK